MERCPVVGRLAAVAAWALIALLSWVGTSSAEVRVVSGLSQHFDVAPGGTYRGTISVLNAGTNAESVLLYQRDYRFAADGGSTYGEPGSQPRSNARWIQLGPSPVLIPPGKRVDIPYRIAVPENPAGAAKGEAGDDGRAAAFTGTYWSMIMVEAQSGADAPVGGPLAPKQLQLGIQQRLRYGVQVITDFGDSGAPKLVAEQPKLATTPDGTVSFQVDLHNQGTRWSVPKVWIELYSADGKLQGRFAGSQQRLYPETSVREAIDFGRLKPGVYQAVFIADGGDNAVFGVRYRFDVKAA
ncbi:MAG TPA: hypothetical protein VFK80_07900 [Limnochordia bacterium]|nr:hypothetical protein [Limnochordia bacterium]